MKALRVCNCMLLCVSSVAVLGCNKADNAVVTQQIHVTACVATPDSVSVRDMDPVIWIPDVDYLVTFTATITPSGPVVPVSTNPFTIKAGTTVPQIMHGPSNCSTAGCYYKYSLTKFKNGVPESFRCIDPGIRIVP